MKKGRIEAVLAVLAVFCVAQVLPVMTGCVTYRAKRLAACGKNEQALALVEKHFVFAPELRAHLLDRLGRLDEAYEAVTLGLARGAGNQRHLTLLAAKLAARTGRTIEALEWFERAGKLEAMDRPGKKQAQVLWLDAARRFLASSDTTGALGALIEARRFGSVLPPKLCAVAMRARIEDLLRWSGLKRAQKAARRLVGLLGPAAGTSQSAWAPLLGVAQRAGQSQGAEKALLKLCHHGLWAAVADALQGRPGLAGRCRDSCADLAVCGLKAAAVLGRPGLLKVVRPLLRPEFWRGTERLVTSLRPVCLAAASLDAPACRLLRGLAIHPGRKRERACRAYLEALGRHGGRDEAFALALWSQENRRSSMPCGVLDGTWRLALGPVGPWSESGSKGQEAASRGPEIGGKRARNSGPESNSVHQESLPVPEGMLALEMAWRAGRQADMIRIANRLAEAHRAEPLVRLELGRRALVLGRFESAMAHLHWAEALAQGGLGPLVSRQVRRLEGMAARLALVPTSGHKQQPGAHAAGSVSPVSARQAGTDAARPGRSKFGTVLSWASSSACVPPGGSLRGWVAWRSMAAKRKTRASLLLDAMALRGASVCRWPWVWRWFQKHGLSKRGAVLARRLLALFPRSEEILLSRVVLADSGLSGGAELAARDFRWYAADRRRADARLVEAWLNAGRCENAGRALGFFLERLGVGVMESREAVRLLAWFHARCERGVASKPVVPWGVFAQTGHRSLAEAAVRGLRRGRAPSWQQLRVVARWPVLGFSVALAFGALREAATQALRWHKTAPLSPEPLCALAMVALRSHRFESARALLARAAALDPAASCVAAGRLALSGALGH